MQNEMQIWFGCENRKSRTLISDANIHENDRETKEDTSRNEKLIFQNEICWQNKKSDKTDNFRRVPSTEIPRRFRPFRRRYGNKIIKFGERSPHEHIE